MQRFLLTKGGRLAVAAAVFAVPSIAGAVVQSYSAASGEPGVGVDHPGFGFFQLDAGAWDSGLDAAGTSPPGGEFEFSGSDGAFTMEARALLNAGFTGQIGDHAAFFMMDYNPAPPNRSFGTFWFGGIGNDAGPLPSTTLANVLVYADVLTQAGTPFEFRIESDYTGQSNGFRFRETGTGGWQTVGGALTTAVAIGSFNAADANLALLIAFGHGNEITAVDDGTDPSRVPTLRIDNLTITIAQASWASDSSGDWTNNAQWTPFAPDGANATAIFGNVITAPTTVTVNGERFAGTLQFDSPQPYTLGGSGPLIIRRVGAGAGGLNVVNGNHAINAPLVLHSSTDANIASGAALTVSNLQPATSAVTVSKLGSGTLHVNAVRAGALNVAGGRVAVLSNGVSRVNNLSIAGGAAVDLNSGALILDYSTALGSPIAQIASSVASGYNGGSWNGSGINSSAAAATPNATALGYAEASSVFTSFPATFLGEQVDNTSVLVRYTRVGDANLDGTTDIGDFSLLAANFNQPGNWAKGDFDYDGQVAIGDFSLLAANFNLSVPSSGGRAAVPEPSAMLAGGLFCFAGLRRRVR